MTLEELLSKVSDETLKEQIADFVAEQKDYSVSQYRKKDKEVLDMKIKLKTKFGIEDLNDLDDIVDKYTKNSEESTKSKLTINSLNERVEELINSLNNEREAKIQIEKKAKTKTLEAELTSHIGDKFYGSKYLIKDLINDGAFDIDTDGSLFYKSGDTVLPFDKGIEAIKEKNKDMLRISQTVGSGDTGGKTDTTKLMDKPTEQVLKELGLIK